ncbi:MAG: PRC-barrel domain-containing protein [Hyphomicrobiaceae bacterium]
MKTMLPVTVAASLLLSSAALAQTSTTTPAPATPPATTTTTPSVTPGTTESNGAGLTMTEQDAKNWVGKTVYSSDAKNVGEVAAIQRDSGGKVTELHADIGGFLGIGETRVRVMPGQFKVENDRIVLNMTSEQARTLPKIAK